MIDQSSVQKAINILRTLDYNTITIEAGPTICHDFYHAPKNSPDNWKPPVEAILLSTYDATFTPEYVYIAAMCKCLYTSINTRDNHSIHSSCVQ